MIQAVKSFDPISAAGVLARAALSVGYVDHPVGGTTKADEHLIARVIEEALIESLRAISQGQAAAINQMVGLGDEIPGAVPLG